jgi:hypothetical protein
MNPITRRLALPPFLLGAILCLALTPRLGFADRADDEFASRLLAHGYYDLLELQYKDWVSDENLPAEDRVQKSQGLIALYTALSERAADQRDRKRYQQLVADQIAQLKKQSIPPALAMRLEMNEAQLLLDDVRAMGTVPPPVVNDEGETKPSAVETTWNKVIDMYSKVSKGASKALEDLLRAKKTGAEVVAEQTQLEGLVLESGLRSAWARYYFVLALPAKDERRMKFLKDACGTFEMTAASYPNDKDLRAECLLGSALCAKEMGNRANATDFFDKAANTALNQNIVRAAYYNKAVMLFDAKQYEGAYQSADAATKIVSRTPDEEVERASLLLKAKAGYALAATKEGAMAAKIRSEAQKAATEVAEAGGKWAPMAQELLVTGGGATGAAEGAGFESLVKADKLYDQQKWAEALAAYENFIARKPPGASRSVVAGALMKLGFCYYRQKAYSKSAEAFKSVMDSAPDPALGARVAYYMAVARGFAAAQSNKPEDLTAYLDALSLLEKRYPTHDDMNNIMFRFGAALETAGKYAEAGQRYRKVSEAAKEHREAQLRAGICDVVLLTELWKKNAPAKETAGLLESAVKSLKAASAPAGEDDPAGQRLAADACLRLARLYMTSNVSKPQEALNVVKDFEKKYAIKDVKKEEEDKTMGDALFIRFWAYEKLAKIGEARDALAAAVARQPDSPQIAPAFETLAVDCDDAAQKATGAEAQQLRLNAVAFLTSYLEQFGKSRPEGYERLLMRRANAYAALAAEYDRASKKAKGPEAEQWAKKRSEAWSKAMVDYQALYKLYPGALNINKALASAYAQVGQYQDALKIYKDLEEGTERYSPDWWEARYNVALMYSMMNDTDSMARVIVSVYILREDLGGPEFQKKFSELILKYIEGLQAYQAAGKGTQVLTPDWWQTMYNVALTLQKQGNETVFTLIDALRILRKDLGGPELQKKFEDLLQKAGGATPPAPQAPGRKK